MERSADQAFCDFQILFVFKVGHSVQKKTKPLFNRTHHWRCYVDSWNPKYPLSAFVKKVTFKLHDTFENPRQGELIRLEMPVHSNIPWFVRQAPFAIEEDGFGNFQLQIEVAFLDCVTTFAYDLILFDNNALHAYRTVRLRPNPEDWDNFVQLGGIPHHPFRPCLDLTAVSEQQDLFSNYRITTVLLYTPSSIWFLSVELKAVSLIPHTLLTVFPDLEVYSFCYLNLMCAYAPGRYHNLTASTMFYAFNFSGSLPCDLHLPPFVLTFFPTGFLQQIVIPRDNNPSDIHRVIQTVQCCADLDSLHPYSFFPHLEPNLEDDFRSSSSASTNSTTNQQVEDVGFGAEPTTRSKPTEPMRPRDCSKGTHSHSSGCSDRELHATYASITVDRLQSSVQKPLPQKHKKKLQLLHEAQLLLEDAQKQQSQWASSRLVDSPNAHSPQYNLMPLSPDIPTWPPKRSPSNRPPSHSSAHNIEVSPCTLSNHSPTVDTVSSGSHHNVIDDGSTSRHTDPASPIKRIVLKLSRRGSRNQLTVASSSPTRRESSEEHRERRRRKREQRRELQRAKLQDSEHQSLQVSQ
ncbi:uncharacterized protein DEA37_0003271, partial [Paragonimus westermani]